MSVIGENRVSGKVEVDPEDNDMSIAQEEPCVILGKGEVTEGPFFEEAKRQSAHIGHR